jgi:hypothetical protein
MSSRLRAGINYANVDKSLLVRLSEFNRKADAIAQSYERMISANEAQPSKKISAESKNGDDRKR